MAAILMVALFMVPANASAANHSADVNEISQQNVPNARVRVKVINLLGIEISPCGLSLFFDVKVRVKQPNDNGLVREFSYSCNEDLSAPIYIQPGTEVTGIISITGTPLSNGGTIIVKESDIDPNGQTILDISVTVDISLP